MLAGMLLLVAAAWADCTPYASSQVVADLQTLQLSLRALDESSFSTAAERMDQGLHCLSSAVPAPVFASMYRYLGAYHHLKNDDATARKYFRTALEIDPAFEWDAADLDMDSPIRSIFDEERAHATDSAVAVVGKTFAAGTYTLDGRAVTSVAATQERPHTLLKLNGDKTVASVWVFDGNAFPTDALVVGQSSSASKTTSTTKSTSTTKTSSSTSSSSVSKSTAATTPGAVAKLERKRPPEKTPLIVGGVVGVVGAAALYGYTFVTHGEFEASHDPDEIEQLQTLNNALILTSGGLLLVGVGVGYWGIVLDGGGAVGVTTTF